MTPKELRAAANHAVNDLIVDRRLNGDKIMQMCQHILVTVLEDDGEPVTEDFVSSLGFWWDGNEGSWTPTDESPIAFYDAECGEWYCSACGSIGIKTRGQFRKLCEGLGIELKEKKQ